MLTPQEARRRFSELVRGDDDSIGLAEAALLVSAGQGSDSQVELYLAQLSSIAERVRLLLRADGIDEPARFPLSTVVTINRVLFDEEGFTGNRDDYYDVENSYLDRVLVRKTGIPITLSIVYLEVAARVGLPMDGIGLPGHFVVAYGATRRGGVPQLIVDPFCGGQLLTLEDCARRVQAAYGGDVAFTEACLRPLTNRQILERVLNNLKQILIALDEHRAALGVIDMLLSLSPGAVSEMKERGLIYYRLGEFMLALGDLRRYSRLAPDGEEKDKVRYYIGLLNRLLMSCN